MGPQALPNRSEFVERIEFKLPAYGKLGFMLSRRNRRKIQWITSDASHFMRE